MFHHLPVFTLQINPISRHGIHSYISKYIKSPIIITRIVLCLYIIYTYLYQGCLATAPDSQGLTLSHTTWVLSWSFKIYIFRWLCGYLILHFFHDIYCTVLIYASFISATWWNQTIYFENVTGDGKIFFFLNDKCDMVSSKVLPTILMNLLLSCLLTLTIIFWRKQDLQSIPKLLIWKHYLIVKWVYEWKMLTSGFLPDLFCTYVVMGWCLHVYLWCTFAVLGILSFPPLHSIFYSSLVFLNLTELVKEILGNQVLES